MRRHLALAASLIGVWIPPAWAACPLDLGRGTGWVVYSGPFLVAFRPDPLRIEVGEPFVLVLNVCMRGDRPAELVAVDAQMPDHRHGMNYRPTIIADGNGRYRAEGMVFHMPGRWEVTLDVRASGESERLTHDIIVK